jgi:phosphoenolpyruvate synthase/pyruvate phosphate dikinase
MLVQRYIKITEKMEIWPPLTNFSPFIMNSGWHTKKYAGKFHKDNIIWPTLTLIKGLESMQFMTADKVKKMAEQAFREYFSKNPKLIKERRKIIEKYSKDIRNKYEELTYKKVQDENLGKLIRLTQEILDTIWTMNSAGGWFTVYFDKDFCWQQICELKLPISRKRFEMLWDKGIDPICLSFDKEQELHILDLLRKNDYTWKDIAEKCQFFYASYFDVKNVEFTEKELIKKYSQFRNENLARKKLKQEKASYEKKVKNFEKWRKGLRPIEKKLVDYFQAIIRLRDERKNIFCRAFVIQWRLAQRMFREAGIDEKFIIYYTFGEMKNGVDYLLRNKKRIIKRAKGFCVLVNYSGKIEMEEVDFNKEKKVINNYYLEKSGRGDGKELKGQVGSPGKIKGVVKIVLKLDKSINLKAGEILVTGMTRPEFVPLMRRAAAIITDEGGITCHAAIISRELKKPCIIGTKIATRFLKDGDLVEVDANKGIVKLLKRNK